MEKIVIKTSLEKNIEAKFIKKVYDACRCEFNLSPRPLKEIKEAYKNHNLLFALNNRDVAGWLIVVPFNKDVQELVAGYTIKKYRGKNIFNSLIKVALKRSKLSLGVTFNPEIEDRLLKKFNFTKSSLFDFVILSRGKFLLNRINKNRLVAIINHYKHHKPTYLKYANE